MMFHDVSRWIRRIFLQFFFGVEKIYRIITNIERS